MWTRMVVVLCLVLAASSARAQNAAQIRRGTPLYFDHDEQSIEVTTAYQLCEDIIDTAHCKDVEAVRLAGTLTFQFAFPKWVSNGAHIYAVRAFGEGEYSDPSNSITLVVTGKPLPPTNHRQSGPSPQTAPQSPTTGAPIPATVHVPGGLSLTKPPMR